MKFKIYQEKVVLVEAAAMTLGNWHVHTETKLPESADAEQRGVLVKRNDEEFWMEISEFKSTHIKM